MQEMSVPSSFRLFSRFFFFFFDGGGVGVNIAKIRRGEKEMAKLIGPFKWKYW